MSILPNSQENMSNQTQVHKLDFTVLQNISGADSVVEIVEINSKKFVLKTFIQRKPNQNKLNAVAKRNREFYYQMELAKLDLSHLEFFHSDKIHKDQLCMNYVENLETFADISDVSKFRKLGEFVQNLIRISQTKITKKVSENGIETNEKGKYFDWLHNFVKNRAMEQHFVDKGLQIIDELKSKTEYLTLLHSDFHTNNIGLIEGRILLFDSGECPYLFGHRFHDLSRLLMYFPERIIFENEIANPVFESFLLGFDFENLSDKLELLKFCYLQSILIKNNSFIARRREIAEYLFTKLV